MVLGNCANVSKFEIIEEGIRWLICLPTARNIGLIHLDAWGSRTLHGVVGVSVGHCSCSCLCLAEVEHSES